MNAVTTPRTADQIKAHIGSSTGEQGFLKWVEAVFPASVAVRALETSAALKANPGLSGYMLSGLGDDTSLTSASDSDIAAAEAYANASTPNASTAGANAPASSSWLSNIGSVLSNAVSAAGQAYLTVNQVQGANQILQTNLQRAQQGLPPLPYTAAQMGLTGPTVNLGLSSTTLTPLLWLGGGLLAVILIGGMFRGGSRASA